MTLLDQLQPASFRAVSISVRNEVKEADGRVRVLHEYPHSSRRYVESLGLMLPIFSAEFFAHGNNFLTIASSFREALKEEGVGKLIMPNFGSAMVYALEFSESASQQSVGIISFSVKFAVGESAVAPATAERTQQDVFQLGDDARTAIKSDFEKKWDIPTQKANNIVSQFDTQVLLGSVEDTIYQACTVTEELDKILGVINFSFPTLVKNPIDYSSALFTAYGGNTGLFQAISTSLNRSRTAVDAILNLSNFGSGLPLTISDIKRSSPESVKAFAGTGIPLWPETTAERIKRNKNRMLFVQSVRVASLISAYEQATTIDYDTTENVKKMRDDLESAYKRIYQDEAEHQDDIQTQSDTLNAIYSVRTASLEVLELKQQQSFSVVDDFDLTGSTSVLKAWQLYQESFDNTEQFEVRVGQLRDLNIEQSSVNLIDDIQVFQEKASII